LRYEGCQIYKDVAKVKLLDHWASKLGFICDNMPKGRATGNVEGAGSIDSSASGDATHLSLNRNV
jgi:hypothetical protein